MDETPEAAPIVPEKMPDGKQRLEFPANILLRVLKPHEGVTTPSLVQIVMWHDRLPFQFIMESPDAEWLKQFANSIVDAALELTENPENTQYLGKQPVEDCTKVDPITFEPVPDSDETGNNKE